MKAIITGGAGFIGGHCVQHFVSSKDEVINVDKLTYAAKAENTKSSPFSQIDICDTQALRSLVKEFKPDFIINFAAETHVDNSIVDCSNFIHSNVLGVSSILNVCKDEKIRLCHISTDEVYGPASDRPFSEHDDLNPKNPYSATKASGDLLIKSFHNTYGLDYLIVRPSNNYGPNQHSEKFIPKLIDCISSGKEFPMYGVGDQEREWTYVEDTVKIIRKILMSENTQWNSIYNLSSGISSKNIETAKLIISTYNKANNTNHLLSDVVKFSKDRPGHDKKYWISSEKLEKIIKHSYTSLEQGIAEVVKQHEKYSRVSQ